MEKISLENIISGLMFIGFDKVDSLLLGYATEELLKSDMYRFVLEEDTTTSLYKHIDYVDGVYQFKEDETLDSMIIFKKLKMPMKTFLVLHSNKKLIDTLKTINFQEIVLKKISSIGVNNLSDMNYLFSSKEKEIIMNIFGITFNNSNKVLRK